MRLLTPSPIRLAMVVAAMLAFALCAPASWAEGKTLKGVALVIGQSKYEHIPALANPVNDAREMVKLLSDLGFDARSVSDRDAKKLKRDLERFVEDAEGADVAFLYYSGHGIESGGENWLVPVDADVSSLDNAGETLVPMSEVMDELKGIVPVTIMLLDACRTNPFPAAALVRKSPGDPGQPMGDGGLTPVRGAVAIDSGQPAGEDLGTVIGFAAEPGRPALDGTGENSPYATALLRHLGAMDGAEFGQVMRMVTEEVYLDTKAKQRPWVNESLRRLLYFGVPQPLPTGEDGEITGERRQLLLTISDLPDANRLKVEAVASKDGVRLDALYGVLRALGTTKIPEDPAELEKLLDSQAANLKTMIAQRDALRTDDPEIVRLTAAAGRAIDQGAIVTARKFLDEAVQRIEANSGAVDAAEEAVKQKRIADAAVYAQRAAASALAFDYAAAAADYRKAFELIERWDDKLRWNYKNLEAEALHSQGLATGDQTAMARSVDAYKALMSFLDYGQKDHFWATTNNNMAAAMQSIGEQTGDMALMEQAAALFGESLAVFEAEHDDANWAAAQYNIANALLRIGENQRDTARIEQAIKAYQAALGRRDRAKDPDGWAATQNSIGIALVSLGDHSTSRTHYEEAVAAYRLALEEYRREVFPVEWAMVENNLGIVLNVLGDATGDIDTIRESVAALEGALEVRTRDKLPALWATTQSNLGNSLNNLGKLDDDPQTLASSEAAFRHALEVFTREGMPLDWASAQNNLGGVLQLIGQRSQDGAKLGESVDAYEDALLEYREDRLPLDFAMANFNMGNSLMLAGQLNSDPAVLRQGVDAYRNALRHFTKGDTPRQWALANAYLGSTFQSLASYDDPLGMYEQSIAARRLALEVLTAENAPVDWANAQSGLGLCLLNLSTFGQRPELLPDAKTAFEASMQVFTRTAEPVQWAFTENNIGDVHWGLATHGGGKSEYEKAIARFESAKQAFTEAGYLPVIPVVDQKISLIKEAMAKL